MAEFRKIARGIVLGCALAGLAHAGGAKPNHWGYDYPHTLDAEIAAPDAHRLRYEDPHIQFLEVANPPGYLVKMHGHPYPSIFARMSGRTTPGGPGPTDVYLDPNSPLKGQNWRNAPAPKGMVFPLCTAADPQSPHQPTNNTDSLLHFYRIEFKRIDQDAPASTLAYSSQPTERVLYEAQEVMLSEVTVAPRQVYAGAVTTEAAVAAFDTQAAWNAVDHAVTADAGRSSPPAGMAMPRCMTLGHGAKIVFANHSKLPIHFYRIDFRRIDGAGLKDHWRDWYPEISRMADQVKP